MDILDKLLLKDLIEIARTIGINVGLNVKKERLKEYCRTSE